MGRKPGCKSYGQRGMCSSLTRPPGRGEEDGFALLEFLVAFGLLATFLAAMLSALAVAIKGDHQAAFLTVATELAKAKLAAAGLDYPLDGGTAVGTFENGYSWRVDVRRQGTIPAERGRPVTGYDLQVTISDP